MPEELVDQRPFVPCCGYGMHTVLLGMTGRAPGYMAFLPIQWFGVCVACRGGDGACSWQMVDSRYRELEEFSRWLA
jgi:hypothetical protein